MSAAWNDPQGAVHGFCELVKSLISDAVNYVVDCWNTLKSALSNPIEAAINFLDHGSVVGGNVQSGEQIRASESSGGGNFSAPTIDTQAAQAGVNELGNASNAAATSTQNLATQIETNSTSAQTLNQNITAIGENANLLQTNLTAIGEGTTAFATNLDLVGTNALTTSTELTNLQNAATTSTPPIQQVGAAATSTSPQILQLGSAAGSAAGSLSQISGAAGSVASALSSKAAEISSIHISVPTVSTVPVAANAEGGIYSRGAFLTTFAEKSPEAAIPLDKSQRSKDLWTKAGQALGTLPGGTPKTDKPNSSIAEKIYSRRVEEVQKMQERQKNIPQKNIPQPAEKIPQVESPKLTAEEQKILSKAAEQMQKTGRATLPPPTENSTAEYRRRYENHQKIQAAIDYNEKIFPQPSRPTKPTGSTGSTSIYSRRPRKSLPEIQTAPNFNPTIPRQNKLPSVGQVPSFGNIFGKIFGKNSPPQIDKIFSGSVKLPQWNSNSSPSQEFQNVGGIVGGAIDRLSNPTDNASLLSQESLPPITVNITINGNANAETMQTAGRTMAVDLRKQLDDWWNGKQRDLERRSFV